ncbi:NAD(P)H-binding protein [Okibacterium endophyticum]
MAIVITGSTGLVGRHVAEEVARRHAGPIRLVVRDPARAPAIPGAEIVVADWDDRQALASALREGDRVFMVSLPQPPEVRIALQGSFVEAASAAQVDRIVYLSFINPAPDAVFHHARSHYIAEHKLRSSGVPWVAIRNAMYSDDIPEWFDADGVTRVPVGTSRISWSYRAELAEAIAVALLSDGHENRIYNVTGSEAVTMDQVAAIASEVAGVPYRYEPGSRELWVSRYHEQHLNQDQITWRLSEFDAQEAGELELVTDDYRLLTGKEPRSIREILELHRAALPIRATSGVER